MLSQFPAIGPRTLRVFHESGFQYVVDVVNVPPQQLAQTLREGVEQIYCEKYSYFYDLFKLHLFNRCKAFATWFRNAQAPQPFPESCICPISCDWMNEPVRTKYGNTYERDAIEIYVQYFGSDPLNDQPLTLEDLNADDAIANLITMVRVKDYVPRIGTTSQNGGLASIPHIGRMTVRVLNAIGCERIQDIINMSPREMSAAVRTTLDTMYSNDTYFERIHASRMQKRCEALSLYCRNVTAPPPLPEACMCPITYDWIVDPVRTPYGHIYEREAILIHIKHHGTDPLNNKELRPRDVVAHDCTRELVHMIREKYAVYSSDILRVSH